MSLYFWQAFSPLETVFLVDFASAILAHAWFRKYEPHTVSSGLVQLVVFATAPVTTAVWFLQSPLLNGPLHFALFVAFLLSSITLYRVSPFHPLARYPGPLICKVSNLWAAWVSWNGKLYLYYEELHKKYGPIVRIGPNELLVVDLDLMPEILGQQGMPKGPQWDGRQLYSHKLRKSSMSLIGVRDYNIHAQLRKPWNRSFGPNAIQDYEVSLVERGTELIDHLKEICRISADKFGHADIADYINRWSFDFMGDAIFGESFGLMRNGDKEGLVHQIAAAAELASITQMIPWAAGFVRSIPIYNRKIGNFSKFAVGQAQRRLAKVTDKRDLFYHLAAAMKLDDDKLPVPLMLSNVGLAIIAGSDTTSNTLSWITYYLIRNPHYFQRLRQELDNAFPPSEHAVIKPEKLTNLELLNAIINESLRLRPAVPTGLQRAPAENSGGSSMGGIFIQEGTAVRISPYVMHHDTRYFSPRPHDFWPERWITQSDEIITNRAAFIAFSYGPANCVGRALATSELRFITAMLVYNFDFLFEDGYDPDQWDRDWLDHFITAPGKLPVKLRQRDI